MLASVLLHIGGSMDLLTTIIMIISSYLIYAQLDNAGKYSALLRTVDVCVSQAQDGIYRTFVESRREAASWRL